MMGAQQVVDAALEVGRRADDGDAHGRQVEGSPQVGGEGPVEVVRDVADPVARVPLGKEARRDVGAHELGCCGELGLDVPEEGAWGA